VPILKDWWVGAGEDTILARVGEGIVLPLVLQPAIKMYWNIQDSISKVVLHKGLDQGTAFEYFIH